ncbi:hypothetical protein [Paenibacillus sp. F411]|uniref:hypothetical protein n=1 Tax=Paenibacillus sp. F411 TaxID=2820239 RepID=UPI001FB92EF0|nr:hypothetical protein [Paenibacillus sp. F411]
MNFQKWDIGGKLIFIAACAAFVSLFFDWVDIGFASQNGFGQGAVFFFLLFLYPLIVVIREQRLNKLLGYILAAVGVIFSIIYISSKSVDFLGSSVNAAGSGPYVFIVACILLAVGIFKRVR